eukprot:s64_g7.t1
MFCRNSVKGPRQKMDLARREALEPQSEVAVSIAVVPRKRCARVDYPGGETSNRRFDALRQAVADVEERPAKRRCTLDEVPLIHTYTNEQGQLYSSYPVTPATPLESEADAMSQNLAKAKAFCEQFALKCPVLMAPMAGASPVALAAAVANAGGMGACGVLGMSPTEIKKWSASFRERSAGPLQLNTWIPEPAPPLRDAENEQRLRDFLGRFGPEDAKLVDFEAQAAAMIDAKPEVISSIMGVYPPHLVKRMKEQKIRWFAVATTVAEALAAEAAGADAIVAQGMEAGGHRGAFRAEDARVDLALLPQIVDAVQIPVIATGGLCDARQTAAALLLGASAVQIGTGLLRCPEAGISKAWADALQHSRPEDTVATRAFSGRLGRSLKNAYVRAAEAPDAPAAAPYPAVPAEELVATLWTQTCDVTDVTMDNEDVAVPAKRPRFDELNGGSLDSDGVDGDVPTATVSQSGTRNVFEALLLRPRGFSEALIPLLLLANAVQAVAVLVALSMHMHDEFWKLRLLVAVTGLNEIGGGFPRDSWGSYKVRFR